MPEVEVGRRRKSLFAKGSTLGEKTLKGVGRMAKYVLLPPLTLF